MAEVTELKASARPRAGKGAARQVRREGRVPAVIYGDKKTPETISLDYNDLWRTYTKGRFTATVFDISVDGKTHRVLARDIQLDPVKDIPVHVDFQRIGADGRVRVYVPVRFVNDALSPGLKRGGVLNIVRHEIEVIAPADNIPAFFEANLEGMEIGRSLHISAIKLPEGVKPTITDRDFTVATIAGAVKEEAAATETTAAAPGAAPAAAAAAPAGDAKAAGGKAAPAAAAPKAGGDAKKK